MSKQSDARVPKDSDEWKPRSATKRSRRRPWLIEYRTKKWEWVVAPNGTRWMKQGKTWGEWKKHNAYETQKRRDDAFMATEKQQAYRDRYWYRSWEFRKVDPE